MSAPTPYTFLLIDKPTGRSSFSIVAQVRRVSKIKRVGHAGTLDPLATGLLIVLVGREATREQGTFLHMDKWYECTARFGQISDTYDKTGEVSPSATWEQLEKISERDVFAAMKELTGQIQQTVPAFSAVKRQGQKLYDMARKGTLDLETLPVRTVQILQFELKQFRKDEHEHTVVGEFIVHCSSGTYIRSLIHDLGQKLAVGAVVTQLRRTQIGEYSVKDAIDVETLTFEDFSSPKRTVDATSIA